MHSWQSRLVLSTTHDTKIEDNKESQVCVWLTNRCGAFTVRKHAKPAVEDRPDSLSRQMMQFSPLEWNDR